MDSGHVKTGVDGDSLVSTLDDTGLSNGQVWLRGMILDGQVADSPPCRLDTCLRHVAVDGPTMEVREGECAAMVAELLDTDANVASLDRRPVKIECRGLHQSRSNRAVWRAWMTLGSLPGSY